jgi:hypothetical protein
VVSIISIVIKLERYFDHYQEHTATLDVVDEETITKSLQELKKA